MPAIKYETPDGIEVIERDEFHTEKDGVVIAYDDGPEHKVTIPQERVVIIHG